MGANFEVRNSTGQVIHQGVTPGTITLNASDGYFKKAEYTIVFRKDGYADQVNNLTSSLDGWYVANIVFGGLIGLLIVDPATGAMYKLPEGLTANLLPVSASAADNQTVTIVDISVLSDVQRAALEPIM